MNNRSKTIEFLTRHYGFDTAVHLVNAGAIPKDMADVIEQKVLSQPVQRPCIDWNDENIQQIFEKYIARTYPNQVNFEKENLTEHDLRMIHTMSRLRVSYTNYSEQRRKTVLSSLKDIEKARATSPVLKSAASMAPKSANNAAPKSDTNVAPKKCTTICRAVKMNGEKCTAKAKNGTQYCCRHSKK